MADTKGVETMMEDFFEIMTYAETAKSSKIRESILHVIARKGKILAVEIEFWKISKVIMRVPYNQELIKKVKMISGRKWNSEEKYWKALSTPFWIRRRYECTQREYIRNADMKELCQLKGEKRWDMIRHCFRVV